jgi:hypothetical protein
MVYWQAKTLGQVAAVALGIFIRKIYNDCLKLHRQRNDSDVTVRRECQLSNCQVPTHALRGR